MRKFVSPRAARKVLDTVNKTFGVPLEELLRQMPADGCTVPAAVKRICEYIYKHGELSNFQNKEQFSQVTSPVFFKVC